MCSLASASSTSPLPRDAPLVYAVRRSALLQGEACDASFAERLDGYFACLEAWYLAEAFPNVLLRATRKLGFVVALWCTRRVPLEK